MSNKSIIDLPLIGFMRLPAVLAAFPVGRSTWWKGVAEGRYPAPVKLGPRTTAWRVSDIRALLDAVGKPEGRRP
jgi:predicted DNA-binding transcriptional regulator AlpA